MNEIAIAGLIIAAAVIWLAGWVRRCKDQRTYIMDAPSKDCQRKYVS